MPHYIGDQPRKEHIMNFRSLVLSQNREVARPEAFLFGPLHREVDRLFDDFARSLTAFVPPGQLQGFPTIMPKMDVTETDSEIEITVEMPGLQRKDVDISLEDDVLTIRGEKVERFEGNGAPQAQQGEGQQAQQGSGGQRKGQAESQQQGAAGQQKGEVQAPPAGDRNKSYHVSERSYGVFLRVLQLPPGIDPNSIEASMSNGVLRIRIPNAASAAGKKINVKEAA
jgi:HSP20 family protein